MFFQDFFIISQLEVDLTGVSYEASEGRMVAVFFVVGGQLEIIGMVHCTQMALQPKTSSHAAILHNTMGLTGSDGLGLTTHT